MAYSADMTVFRSSLTISSFTLGSRLLGFVRDVIMALVLGAGPMADAFFVALRLPNLFRQLMAEGAFNVAFVPMLARKLGDDGTPKEAEDFANAVFSVLFAATLAVTVLGMVFMPALVAILAPGFLNTPETYELAVTLGRITFPYLTFIVFVSFTSGINNTLGRFAAGAAAPILLNVAFIFCLIVLPKTGADAAHAAAYAVPLGGVLQALLMVWATRRNKFRLKWQLPHNHPQMGTLFKRLGASMLGVGVQLFNSMFGMFLASTLATGSISYLFYADRLNQLPLALVGIAIGTALLPHLSRALKKDDTKSASQSFEQAVTFGLCLALAAAGGLFVLSHELIQILFMRGAFDVEAAHLTALALMGYSVGLPAYILVKITSAVFYAGEDTTTPFQTALLSMVINVIASLALIGALDHVGIALAGALAAWVNMATHSILIYKRGLLPHIHMREFGVNITKVCLLNGLLIAVLWGFKTYMPMPDTGMLGTLWLAGVIVLTFVVFVIGLIAFGLLDKSLLRRFKKVR